MRRNKPPKLTTFSYFFQLSIVHWMTSHLSHKQPERIEGHILHPSSSLALLRQPLPPRWACVIIFTWLRYSYSIKLPRCYPTTWQIEGHFLHPCPLLVLACQPGPWRRASFFAPLKGPSAIQLPKSGKQTCLKVTLWYVSYSPSLSWAALIAVLGLELLASSGFTICHRCLTASYLPLSYLVRSGVILAGDSCSLESFISKHKKA